jgi:hypothetical protein
LAASGVESDAIFAWRKAEYPSANAPMTRRARLVRSERRDVGVACVVDTSILPERVGH